MTDGSAVVAVTRNEDARERLSAVDEQESPGGSSDQPPLPEFLDRVVDRVRGTSAASLTSRAVASPKSTRAT